MGYKQMSGPVDGGIISTFASYVRQFFDYEPQSTSQQDGVLYAPMTRRRFFRLGAVVVGGLVVGPSLLEKKVVADRPEEPPAKSKGNHYGWYKKEPPESPF